MLINKTKLILSAGLILSLSAASFAVYKWGYQAGVSKEAERQSQAVLQWQKHTTAQLQKLQQIESTLNVETQRMIEDVRNVQDNGDNAIGLELDRLCAEGSASAC